MRLYIRRLTDALKEYNGLPQIPVTDKITDELKTWIEAKYIVKERSWLLPGISTVTDISTDSSNFALEVVIKSQNIEETIYFPEGNEMTEKQIMIKEAYAILLTLQNYYHKLRDRRIMFANDNQAVVECFEHGSRNKLLTKVIRQIHETGFQHTGYPRKNSKPMRRAEQ